MELTSDVSASSEARTAALNISARDVTNIGRCLNCMFVGLPLCALGLLFGFHDWIMHQSSWLMLPAGSAIVITGLSQLRAMGVSNKKLPRIVLLCLIFAFGVLLISPFLVWWRWTPRDGYLTLNLFCLLTSYVAMLACVSWLCSAVGSLFQEKDLRDEGLFVAWLVLIAWSLPGVAGLGYFYFSDMLGESGEPLGWHVRNVFAVLGDGRYRWIPIGLVGMPTAFACAVVIKARKLIAQRVSRGEEKEKTLKPSRPA